jgi:DNA excision repair protein ERCC-2
MSAAAKPNHTVQVRELVAFAWRSGDLGGEREFVGSDRAMAGIRGHQKIQRSRPAGYQTEIPVEHLVVTDEFELHIRGRIDGLYATVAQVWLEEIKTIQGKWDGSADPLHWAQAKFYGFIHAHDHGLEELEIRLTYLELATGQLTEWQQMYSLAELSEFASATIGIYVGWLRDRHQWCLERDQSIRALAFPFPAYRAGQRELAVAAYRVLAGGGRLFLAAPTGIGKTISVLFPAVKALGEGKLERIFYLTARTVGRAIAEKACADLRRGGLKLRVVSLTAKERVCVQEGRPCDPLTCPLALGYYDRLKPALREALSREEISRAALDDVARRHQVCPFELSLDVSVWSDTVICDYNYLFDPQVYLRRHFSEEGGDYGFLVDEAHNLVDRAREMFSAELASQEILAVKKNLRRSAPRCARALTRLHAGMLKLVGARASSGIFADPSDPGLELNLFPAAAATSVPEETGVSTLRELPAPLVPLVEAALGEAEAWLAQNQPAPFREELLALYFRLFSFRRTAGLYDARYATILETSPDARVRLFCLDPSFLLRQALARGRAAIFFSATLTPMDYFRTVLGGAPEDPQLQLPSPFPSAHLAVLIQDRIQTRWAARASSLGEVVAAIGALVQGRRGNYLVYFPSYQYLNTVLAEFQTRHPTLPVLPQRPGMTEAERDGFLAAFGVERGDTLVGFAVLGGIFGEGIDLVGERLIGAVIVGVGLPQLCIERDLIRDFFQQPNTDGFDFAYTFPGMNRVLQAIGRVIRSETDRGVVLLIDARFGEPRYRRLFPPWWKFTRVRTTASLSESISRFWQSES